MTAVRSRQRQQASARAADPDGGAQLGAAAFEAAFEDAVARHQAPVWRYLRLLGAGDGEAGDLMQDAFVVLGERLARGDTIRDPAAFLRGTARNLLVAARRRGRRTPPAVPFCDAVDAFVAETPDAFDDARLERLRACLEALGARARDAVVWHHVEGRDCDEVGGRLGLGSNGTKSLLARARRALRDCVDRRTRQEERT